MANTKGNIYPVWFITPAMQVFARDSNGNNISKSAVSFARDISVSEDGTVWVLSNIPDPDGGGGKIFWGNGDGNWNEINTPAPGGIKIAGAGPQTCLFLPADNSIWNMNIQGAGKQLYKGNPVYDIDNGGGYTWIIMPDKPGDIPSLHYGSFGTSPLVWKKFNGLQTPSSIAAAYNSACYGVASGTPVWYSRDGNEFGPFGNGARGIGLRISFKNWLYLITTNANSGGNQVMRWQDINGGTYVDAGFRASRVASTYYMPG